jgi:hypothetical protein
LAEQFLGIVEELQREVEFVIIGSFEPTHLQVIELWLQFPIARFVCGFGEDLLLALLKLFGLSPLLEDQVWYLDAKRFNERFDFCEG